ncbi:MAG: helicase-exonuclease AddAB subunit AddA [Lachnospiraceae bacterium]
MAIEYTKAQKQVIEKRDRNLLVSAAAGSGKTAVLVERICQMVTDKTNPMDIDELLVVTFTNAAAAEMKTRVMNSLQQRLKEDSGNAHLQRQVSLVHSAQITTIDGFCLQFLKEHFYLLDLEPGFRIVDENERTLIMEDVMERVLGEFYQEADPDFLDFVERYTQGKTDDALSSFVYRMFATAQSCPWPEKWLSECEEDYDPAKIHVPEDLKLVDLLLQDARKKMTDAVELLRRAQTHCRDLEGLKKLTADLQELSDSLSFLTKAQQYETFYTALQEYKFPTMPRLSKLTEEEAEIKEEAKAARDEAKDIVKKLKENSFFLPGDQVVKDHLEMQPQIRVLCRMSRRFMEAFAKEKQNRNVVDFGDLEHFTLNILYDEEGVVSPVAEQYRKKFREIMIDEYQDSNALQEAILTAISGETAGKKNLFMVGDVKQSIYRFRQAKPELFIEKYRRYRYEDSEDQKIDLDLNFRSRQQVLRFSNYIFDGLMQEDLGEVPYDEHASLKYGASYDRQLDDLFEATVVVADGKTLEEKKEVAEAGAIAEKIRQLMEDGRVTEGEDYRPVRYSDIVILLRKKNLSKGISEELKAQGIPVVDLEKTGYFKTPEVSCVLSFLQVLDNYRQDIPLAAVLASPMVGLSKKQLAQIRAMAPESTFFEAVQCYDKADGIGEKLGDFFQLLQEFRKMAVYLPIHELLQELYEKTGYYDYVQMMPQGQMRRMNLDILVQRAKAYEQTSYHGLFHFLRYIDKLKEYDMDLSEGGTSDGQDAVRLMTIHKSKGLEFPIVIVAGLGNVFYNGESREALITDGRYGIALKYTDAKRRITRESLDMAAMKSVLKADNLAEEIRVLYVALTRAKEKLILTGAVRDLNKIRQKSALMLNEEHRLTYSSKLRAGSFYQWILPLLYDNLAHTRADFTLKEHEPGEPCALEEAVDRFRLAELIKEPAGTKEGQERIREQFSKEYHHKKELDLKQKMSVSEIKHHFMERAFAQDLLDQGASGEDWEEPQLTGEGTKDAVPEFMKKTGTKTIPAFLGAIPEENRGAMRGTAMHRVLECMDFAGGFTKNLTLETVKCEIASLLSEGLINESMFELTDPKGILAFFQSEIGHLAVDCAMKKKLRKEQPFVMGIPPKEAGIEMDSEDLVLVQGIIDVFMETEEGIVLLDYKTDAVNCGEELLKRYAKQMELYKHALEKQFLKPVVRVCLYSFSLQEVIDVP